MVEAPYLGKVSAIQKAYNFRPLAQRSSTMQKKSKLTLNILFALTCITILVFLLKAPQETTAKLPKDENHLRFYAIKSKKEAESYCAECHAENKNAPLSAEHPPKFRCLFCHKKTD